MQDKKSLLSRHTVSRFCAALLLLPGVLFLNSCHSLPLPGSAFDDGHLYNLTKKAIALSDSLLWPATADPIPTFKANFIDKSTSPEEYYVTYRAAIEYLNIHKGHTEQALAEARHLHLLFEEKFPEPRHNIYHAHILMINATLQMKLNNYSQAIQSLTLGLRKIQPQNSPCIAGEYLRNLASVSYQQQNYQQSIEYNHQGWNYQLACSSEADFATKVLQYQYYNNIAASYYRLGKYPESLSYYNMALEVIHKGLENQEFLKPGTAYQKTNFEIANAVTRGNKATILALLDAGPEAEKLWNESIEANMQPGYANEHAQLMKLRMAEYLIHSQRMGESRTLLDETAAWIRENGSETGEVRWYRLNALWHGKTGNTEQAYEAYQAYVELNRVRQELKKAFITADIPAQLQHMQQQNIIEELNMQAEMRKIYLTSIISVIIIGLIILFLVWKSWHTTQKNLQYLHLMNKKSELKNRQLQKKNAILAGIMNIVSYDLRSPLAKIREISALMMEDENLNPKYKEWGNLIHIASNQSFSLTHEIQKMNINEPDGQAKNGAILNKTSIHLNQLLRNCIELFQIKAREKEQKIIFYDHTNITVSVDPDQMARVINNLLDNAIKFTPKGGLIEIRTLRCGEHIQILIQDNGIGISEDMKEHVFEMYSYKSDPVTGNARSYGIGLAVCKEIMEKHQGAIRFETPQTGGTLFILELPEKKHSLLATTQTITL